MKLVRKVKAKKTFCGIYHSTCLEYGVSPNYSFTQLLRNVSQVWGGEADKFRKAVRVAFEYYDDLKRELGWKWFIKSYNFPHPRVFMDNDCLEWMRSKMKYQKQKELEEKAKELKTPEKIKEIFKKLKEQDRGYFYELYKEVGNPCIVWNTIISLIKLKYKTVPPKTREFLLSIKPKKRTTFNPM